MAVYHLRGRAIISCTGECADAKSYCAVLQITFSKVADIPEFSDEFSLAKRSVTNDGAGLFLFVESSAEEKFSQSNQQKKGVLPATRIAEPARFVLVQLRGGEIKKIELPELDTTFPHVDVFPDGRILVVGPRSAWRSEDDYDTNGLIFDPLTGDRSCILLGDGIQNISIDSLAKIWVSYFDEGIFGNFGWGGPNSKPVGWSGLNCFSADGKLIWSFPLDDEYGSISDCYALNVQNETASLYFYTEFPLCRISTSFQRRYWKTGLTGCHQFAISESLVLFSGQYKDPQSVGYLASLEDERIGEPQKVEFLLPDRSPISNGQLLGRGPNMSFFDDTGWYRTSLDDIKC